METDTQTVLPETEAADEDVPSDFFDDFNKDEFMEGLSVIDSWGDEAGKRHALRIDTEAVHSVRDLRELIRDGKEEGDRPESSSKAHRRSASQTRLDDYIKPGSRRDPNKTNAAIRRDKEVKVKEYLAKHLESTDDLRPPGTELDDFFDENKPKEIKKVPKVIKTEELQRAPSEECTYVRSKRPSAKRSPTWHHRESPHRSPQSYHKLTSTRLYQQRRFSPDSRYSPRRRSPIRHVGDGFSSIKPRAKYGTRTVENIHRSPIRLSSLRNRRSSRSSKDRRSRNRSPTKRRSHNRSPAERRSRYKSPDRSTRHRSPLERRSRSRNRSPLDRLLQELSPLCRRSPSPLPMPQDIQPAYTYAPDPIPRPMTSYSPMGPYQGPGPLPGYHGPPMAEFPGPGPMPMFPYPQGPVFNDPGPLYMPEMPHPGSGFNPQPVPAPMPGPVNILMAGPSMVPPPQPMGLQPPPPTNNLPLKPYDALAQLVADGKLSKEDYLKLAPNKGASVPLDTKTRVDVLNRCNEALSKLGLLRVPNRLLLHGGMVGKEPKAITSKFCSPLKRQPPVEFKFTRASASTTAQHNKQLIDSIISTIGLDKVLNRPKKKVKNTKDAAVQTSKPYCDVCEIRDSREFYEASTCILPDELNASVHTQVLEEDLMSSRALFHPSGSLPEGGNPMSIAHLTPAQLVSQLAARAKTLKQSDPLPPPQYARRSNYDYDDYNDSRGGQQYSNNNYNSYNRY